MASTNKYLAQNSKSRTGADATNRVKKPGNGAKTMARALRRCVSHHKKLAAPMKSLGNLILMTVVCIVIFWVFMALRPANAQMYGTPGIGRSHGYSGPAVSDFRLTPQDVACYRANYASTLAAQRCADQVGARYMSASRK